jgi:hypothetical protein
MRIYHDAPSSECQIRNATHLEITLSLINAAASGNLASPLTEMYQKYGTRKR